MKGLSLQAEKELRDLASSQELKNDLETVASSRHTPFLQHGMVDVDAYLEFVSEFNAFINHEPKPFAPITQTDFRL